MLERVVGRVVVDRGRDEDGRVGRQAAGERHELLRGGVHHVTLVLCDLVLIGLGRL